MGHSGGTSERLVVQVHEAARADFDNRATELAGHFEPQPPPPTGGFHPKRPIATVIEDGDHLAEQMLIKDEDVDGIEFGQCLLEPNVGAVGFRGEGYSQFKRLAERIASRPELRQTLSTEFVERALLFWCREVRRGEPPGSFTDGLLERASKQVANHRYLIPIATLYLESPFVLGHVRLGPLRSADLNRWWEQVREMVAENNLITPRLAQLRDSLQAAAAAEVTTLGEPIRAREIALGQVEQSVSMLRLFSPVLLGPYKRSLCKPLAHSELGVNIVLRLTEDGVSLADLEVRMPPELQPEWRLSDSLMEQLWPSGLRAAHDLLVKEERTEFEETVISALLQYSRSALKAEPADKLLYIISALESVLLPESSELTKNLQLRMALLLGKTYDERTAITKAVSTAYRLRSDFVHRNLVVADLGAVREFMREAFRIAHKLLSLAGRFETQSEFIAVVDSYKLRGPVWNEGAASDEGLLELAQRGMDEVRDG